MELEIIYHDSDLVVINKPAGLLVHRSRVDVHATEFAMQMLRDQLQQLVYPVHRIDRPTSGALLFALSKEAARELSQQFQDGCDKKKSTAIVRGHPPDSGDTDEPLLERHDKMTDGKATKNKQPQKARTEFVTTRRWTVPFSTGKYPNSRYALVYVTPRTGRKHQIRRHFNHMAWPIIGDTTHGDRRHNRLFRQHFDAHRLMLVASRLSFRHPRSGQQVEANASVGGEFEAAISSLERNHVT